MQWLLLENGEQLELTSARTTLVDWYGCRYRRGVDIISPSGQVPFYRDPKLPGDPLEGVSRAKLVLRALNELVTTGDRLITFTEVMNRIEKSN